MGNKTKVKLMDEAVKENASIPGLPDLFASADNLPVVSKEASKGVTSRHNRKNCTDHQEWVLLDECGGLCPLCGEPLIGTKNGRRMKLYHVAHIYPHSPTTEQLEVLKDVPMPDDVESLDNLILLCLKNHKIQDFYTTRDEYLLLYLKKQQLVATYRAKQESACIGLEEELKSVLTSLLVVKESELTDLSFEPFLVKQKIEEGLLQRKVLNYVSMYYETLKLQFRELDNQRTTTSRKIATQFKLAFLKQTSFSLVLDQEQIFDGLVDWVQTRAGGSRAACEAIVSYFVQDCEVFDAIPE